MSKGITGEFEIPKGTTCQDCKFAKHFNGQFIQRYDCNLFNKKLETFRNDNYKKLTLLKCKQCFLKQEEENYKNHKAWLEKKEIKK